MKQESELQQRLIHYLRSHNIFCFAPLNETFMTLNKGKNYGLYQHYLKMGLEPGILDVWIFKNGKAYVIELKSGGGKLSPSQKGIITRLERENIPVLVTDCFYTAVDWLDGMGVLSAAF